MRKPATAGFEFAASHFRFYGKFPIRQYVQSLAFAFEFYLAMVGNLPKVQISRKAQAVAVIPNVVTRHRVGRHTVSIITVVFGDPSNSRQVTIDELDRPFTPRRIWSFMFVHRQVPARILQAALGARTVTRVVGGP